MTQLLKHQENRSGKSCFIYTRKDRYKYMKKNFRFYVALWGAKAGTILLKLLRRNATFFPGKFAITVCPDFIARIDKPKTVIAVTGTNGKTTVCNMI